MKLLLFLHDLRRSLGVVLLVVATCLGGVPAVQAGGVDSDAKAVDISVAIDPEQGQCLSADSQPLRVVVNFAAQQLRPQIAEGFLPAFDQQVTDFQELISHVQVRTLLLTERPEIIGGHVDEVDDPIVTYIVSALLRIKDGARDEVITLDRVSVDQIFETFLMVARIVQIPLQFTAELLGMILSPIVGFAVDPAGGLVSSIVGRLTSALVALPVSLGYAGIKALVRGLTQQFAHTCLTQEFVNASSAGFGDQPGLQAQPLPQELIDLARSIAISNENCSPVAQLGLVRVIDRTAESMRPQLSGEELARFDDQVQAVRDFVDGNRISVLAVPADPKEVGIIGTLLGIVVPGGTSVGNYLGGILVRLAQGRGADTISLGELTTVNALDYTVIALALTNYLLNQAGTALIPAVPGLPSPVDIVLKFIFAPTAIGIPILREVLTSVCLAEDDIAPSEVTPDDTANHIAEVLQWQGNPDDQDQ